MAPMAGATDKTMRRMSAEHGAVCTVSEMISAKALTMGDKKAHGWFGRRGRGAPYGVQLFGAQPDVMAEAASALLAMCAADPMPHTLILSTSTWAARPENHRAGRRHALLKNPPLAGARLRTSRAGRGGRSACDGETAHWLGRGHPHRARGGKAL